MITALTPAQRAALDQWHAEWLAVGMSTERADRSTAEEAITAMYAHIGRPAPRFVWCDSPLGAVMVLSSGHHNGPVNGSINGPLRNSLWTSLNGSINDSLRDSLRDSLWRSLDDSLWRSLWSSFRSPLRGSPNWTFRYGGALDAYWVAYYLYIRDVLGVVYDPARSAQLDWWADIARSAYWWWPRETTVIISDRPTTCRMVPDRNGRHLLHNTDGPAIAFADGWKVYAIGGVRVPADVVEHPESITGAEWVGLANEEVRRVVIETRGQALLQELGASVVSTVIDPLGHPVRLWKSAQNVGGARLSMVELVNSTPEPDGTHKQYWIRVPNTLRRADSAAAWHCQLTRRQWRGIGVHQT